MTEYIGISEDRLHHMIGVARKAYSIAKDMGYDENFSRKMFMIGFNHDVGYEFSTKQSEHADVSADMLSQIINCDNECCHAIKKHGKYTANKTIEWRILNMSDMLVDSKGKEVNVMERLDDIKKRYGQYSDQYLTACDICYQVGLTTVNLAAMEV